jgi:hypothetical protein
MNSGAMLDDGSLAAVNEIERKEPAVGERRHRPDTELGKSLAKPHHLVDVYVESTLDSGLMACKSFVAGESSYPPPRTRLPSMGLYRLPAAVVGVRVCGIVAPGARRQIKAPFVAVVLAIVVPGGALEKTMG